jgi:hypothetical protein
MTGISSGDSRLRRLAAMLARYAARVMPAERRHWADAMQNEMTYVADDRDAIRWAFGFLRVAHAARLGSLRLLDVAFVRLGGVLLAATLAFDALFAPTLTIAYRTGSLGIAERLGGATAGDDYTRLIPLLEGIPLWIHMLAVTGGLCYVAAIGLLLRRRRAAHIAILVGVGVHVGGSALVQPFIAAIGVAPVPDPSLFASLLLPVMMPLLLALAASSGSRT